MFHRVALLIVGLCCGPQAAQCATLRLHFDPESAQALAAAVANPTLDIEAARRIAALPGTRAMIFHTHEFDAAATPERFASELVATAHGEPLTNGSLQLPPVRDHQAEVQSPLGALMTKPELAVAPVVNVHRAFYGATGQGGDPSRYARLGCGAIYRYAP